MQLDVVVDPMEITELVVLDRARYTLPTDMGEKMGRGGALLRCTLVTTPCFARTLLHEASTRADEAGHKIGVSRGASIGPGHESSQ